MIISAKKIRAALKLIYATLLILETFPLSRIKALMKAHILALSKAPITTAMQILIDRANLVFAPAGEAISGKTVDISGGSSEVVTFNEILKTLSARLDSIKTQVKMAMPGNKAILVKLHLDKVGYYYHCMQSDLVEKLTNLQTIINNTPELTTVLPTITDLKNDIANSYSVKTDQFRDISIDRKNISPLILKAKNILIANFGALNDIFFENLGLVINYFPMDTMFGNQKGIDFLQKNQWIVELLAGEIKNDIRIVFKFRNWLKIQNLSMGDCMIFLSDTPNPTIIPGRAKLAKAGETIEFCIENIGSRTELYMIFAAVTPNEAVKIKATVKRRR